MSRVGIRNVGLPVTIPMFSQFAGVLAVGSFDTTAVLASHVWQDDRGVAWIDDSNVKVIEVVLDYVSDCPQPVEIYEAHGGHLSLAQIHAALAYYHDNKLELDEAIAEQLERVETLRLASLDSPLRNRLRESGCLP